MLMLSQWPPESLDHEPGELPYTPMQKRLADLIYACVLAWFAICGAASVLLVTRW